MVVALVQDGRGVRDGSLPHGEGHSMSVPKAVSFCQPDAHYAVVTPLCPLPDPAGVLLGAIDSAAVLDPAAIADPLNAEFSWPLRKISFAAAGWADE